MIKLFVAFWISLLSVVVYAELGQSEKSVAFTSVQLELIKSKLLFNKGSVDDSLLNLYVDELCKNAASELQLSDRFLQWLDSEKEIKQGLFSARYPMDVASIERLEAFYSVIDRPLVYKYRHLLLGASLNSETDTIPDFTKFDFELKADVDAVLSKIDPANKSLAQMAADLPAMVKSLNLVNREKLVSRAVLDQVALKRGIYPACEYATRSESLKFLIRNHETKFKVKPSPEHLDKSRSPKFESDYAWPMFPIEKPVWVLLINLGQMFDFRVADEVWSRFLRGEGIIRYKGYGMGYSQIENRYRQSEWHPDSICRIISDGGVCGRQARLARRSDHLFGIPSTRMPQPGHAAVASYGYDADTGNFYSFSRQSIAPLKNTLVKWPFGKMEKSIGSSGSDIVGIEHHIGLSIAANKCLASYVKSRIGFHLYKALSSFSDAQRTCILEQALDRCPYNTEVVYNLAVKYENDIGKTKDLIGRIRQFIPGKSGVQFQVVKAPNADLSKTKRSHSRVDDKSKSNIVEWSLLVSHKILCNAYTQTGVDRTAIDFLQKELIYQEAFKRSPYTNEVRALILNLRIQHNELEAVKAEIIKDVRPIVERWKSSSKSKAEELFEHISVPIEYIQSNKDRADYLSIFRKAFTSDNIVLKNKKDSSRRLNALYKLIVTSEIKYLKRAGKKYHQEAKELTAVYENYLM